ncbi:MAG TPA: hypothetical protein VF392_14645 [Terracidiphilus sp.]
MDESGIIRKSDTAMPAYSSTVLKIEDMGGELQFTVTRRIGWLELILMTSVITGCGVYGFLRQEYLFLAMFVVSLGSAVFRWAKGPTTVLRVSGSRIHAAGNLRRWSSSDIEIPAHDVKQIGWALGGSGQTSGLYVWQGKMGLRSTCVLPDISHKDAAKVTDLLSTQLPQYKIGSGPVVSFTLTANE